MTTPTFFGYGSLVNTSTHTYQGHSPARVTGWRRVWCHANTREVAFLSVHRVDGGQIDGLVASVPDADWAALDEREYGYRRHPLDPAHVQLEGPAPQDPHIYQADPDMIQDPSVGHPILLTYLDVVTQGFLRVFGPDGARAFYTSTDGWGPILDDRAAPIYPRAQTLSTQETQFVDQQIALLPSVIQQL